ncbi:methyltransferase-like protein 7A [Homarus americanus]|uniref:Methyltransferase-like protein 7A-like 4 n=1 Tax=Homarus americanus TaxID=6706 RepID=A0A8J5MPG3_HOMAM|nr:methyltransferase-like protein 7A [Homarus americanus]KAG7158840.1 Methyltransferase-like protein 7A-like 4 [Homarus americanus]
MSGENAYHINLVEENADQDGSDEGDLTLMPWCYHNLFTIISIVAVLWVIHRLVLGTQPKWFAYMMYLYTKYEFVQFEEVKKDHFASLSSVVSHDPELRKKKEIRILEIGVGTGVNFAHYPEGTHLVGVDRNLHFKSYWEENRKQFPNIYSGEMLTTSAENIEAVADNSVDVVVITLVLCSVPKIDPILKEVLRVLAPGGKFYFMEHIAEFDPEKHGLRKMMQDVLTYLYVWPFIYDGCCLNRDMLPNIKKAGFSSVEAEKYYAPVPNIIFDVERPNLKGIATK